MEQQPTPTLGSEEIAGIYRRRAGRYDVTTNLYRLVGFRVPAYRKMAVEALSVGPGDTVVEIGCGTGLNFPLLQEAVGPEGRIVGVDLTDAMLIQAQRRVQDQGWSNVELVQSDAAEYRFPTGVDGIMSTFAITLVPPFDRVIRNGAEALSRRGRWVIMDFKMPEKPMARLLVPLAVWLARPFGVRIEMASRHPWESIERHLANATRTDFYMGMVYIVTGEREQTETR